MQDATRVDGVDARSLDARADCSSNAAKTCGRKRVRRMQVELPFFRHQVRELEFKLMRLKLQRASPVAGTVKSELPSPRSVQNLVGKGSRADQNAVWNDIAERQLKQRLRVEQQQQQLKQTHGEMLDLSMELHKLLRRWGEHQVTSGRQTSTWDHFVTCD